jgi:hypothetical protein
MPYNGPSSKNMSNVPVSELAPATTVTGEKSHDWVEGPVWKERNNVYPIPSLGDDKLLSCKHRALTWLGKHAIFIQKKMGELSKLHDTITSMVRDSPQADALYFNHVKEASFIGESVLDRQRRIQKIEEVIQNLTDEIESRNLYTYSPVLDLATRVQEHPEHA